uniref:F-box domain-containing protein n=1 Tax=Steinernema glaseri TaxID=37863 RepID=A0A1I7Z7E2_9BILA
MDALPWKFVDSVVELFGRKTLDELAQEVRHPLWKDVVDLHHNNRMYYIVKFRKEEGDIKPGKRVRAALHRGVHLDINYIQNLLDLWKSSGNLNFDLCSSEGIVDKDGLLALMSKGRETWRHDRHQSFFQHETEKSVAILSSQSYPISCYTCECDRSEKCLLKERYPKYH